MRYKPFHDLQLSWLGMGNMRLPTIGDRGPIDEAPAREIIEYAYTHGINYFDTAYRYHGGGSERFVGRVLSQYPRDTWYLASKMPGHQMQPPWQPAAVFEEQLARCGVDYFDFYLLHNVRDTSYGVYTDEKLGIVDYLLAQKAAGRIRYLGFSAHASAETLERFLDWRDCFDFTQIQLNYLDWTLQNARRKYQLLAERGIPVMVMEPCRGGKLATLSESATALLKGARPDDSIASWAFRFVQSLPGVQVVLSGMSRLDQIEENVRLFSDPAPLTEAEIGLLQQVVASMVDVVPCTACRYCVESCPQNLDIPRLISLYNEASWEPSRGIRATLSALADDEGPDHCIACGACTAACPQDIDVPAAMRGLSAIIADLPAPGAPPAGAPAAR